MTLLFYTYNKEIASKKTAYPPLRLIHNKDGGGTLFAGNGIAALLHEPLRGAGSTADADTLDGVQPAGINLARPLDEMAVGIDTLALAKQDTAVGTFAPADKEYQVVAGGKLRDARHAVGHRAADGVEGTERSRGGYVSLYVVDYAVIFVERLGGLRIQIDVAREIERSHLAKALNDNGARMGLANQPQHLGVAFLAEDDYLRIGVAVVLLLDALLQLQHHGAGGIDNVYVVAARQLVSLRRLAVGAQQHLDTVQPPQVVVVDGHQPHLLQAVALHAVMHNVAQAVERVALGQLFLGLLDGRGHAEAEAAAVVNLYLKHGSVS